MDLLCFDTETTGIDVFNDRVVTFFGGVMGSDGKWRDALDTLIDPGVEIPEGASNVHGITTEYAQENGTRPEQALQEIWNYLEHYRDIPWVVMNANYDISLLQAEFERYGIEPLDLTGVKIYDPLVMDRHHDKYRRGSRKLVDQARHYGIPVDDAKAHAADYDCYLAGNVTKAILARYGDCTVSEQAQWFEDWRANFEQYLRRTNPEAKVDVGWPVRVKEGS